MGRPKASRGQARQRILVAALPLFAEHGVSGTSLQMIADQLGVTKAAVYHQFPAKDDIALALLERLFATMTAVATTADDVPMGRRQEVALSGLVDLMIEQRQVMSALYRDPDLERLVAEHSEYVATQHRLAAHLVGSASPSDLGRRIGISILIPGLVHAVVDEELADVRTDVLRSELIKIAERILKLNPTRVSLPQSKVTTPRMLRPARMSS